MKRLVFVAAGLVFVAAGLVAASLATPLWASCWSNKNICIAICGAECCDGWSLAAPADKEALSQISVDELKAELRGMRQGARNRGFMSAVNTEIRTRGGGATTLRVAPATGN